MRYEIDILPRARKYLSKLNVRDVKLIARAIQGLSVDPLAGDVKKLKGHEAYRKRAGNYRIIYEIDGVRVLVTVVDIDHRKDVYKDL